MQYMAFRSSIFAPLALLAVELLVLQFLRHAIVFNCREVVFGLCPTVLNFLVSGYVISALLFLMSIFARDRIVELFSDASLRPGALALHWGGILAFFALMPVVRMDGPFALELLFASLWIGAVIVSAVGVMLMFAPGEKWLAFTKSSGWGFATFVMAAILVPFVAVELQPLWRIETITDYKFAIVEWLLNFLIPNVYAEVDAKIIGIKDVFLIRVAPQCSGIEGIVLTTLFVSIYLATFRKTLRFPAAFLLLPVAVLISWLLNAVRITALVYLGAVGYPELAIGGFHSHAGWLMFTALAVGIVLVTQALKLFQKVDGFSDDNVAPPFLSDPTVAQILPFAIFMLSALLASTFSDTPSALYPWRVVVMSIGLALFWRYLQTLPWRIDPVACGVGLFIAIYWIAFGPSDTGMPSHLVQLGTGALVFWVVMRVIGTAILVPVIEELFFREYLLNRIAPRGSQLGLVALAVVVNSAAFAALHDRWIEAAVAGLLFSLVYLRRRNVVDAILSHAVANALIVFWAIATGNWAVI